MAECSNGFLLESGFGFGVELVQVVGEVSHLVNGGNLLGVEVGVLKAVLVEVGEVAAGSCLVITVGSSNGGLGKGQREGSE